MKVATLSKSSTGRVAGAGALASGVLLSFIAMAQPPDMVIRNFRAAPDHYPPPHESQVKSLIEGAEATPQKGGYLFQKGVKVQTFREDGVREMVIEAPECFYDGAGHLVNSSGPLQMQTADGRFSITGEGFLWQQADSSLYISNNVHTVVRQGTIEAAPARTNSTAHAARDIEIFSDHFRYDTNSGLGIYTGNVRATGTNLAMTGGILTFDVPMGDVSTTNMAGGGQLKTVTAEDKIIADYQGFHITGERGVYSTETGIAHLTGHPAWRTNLWAGRGEEMFLDRTNEILRANGQAVFEMPGQSLAASGLLQSHKAPQTNAPTATNQFVEILSDNYELHTNWAVFHQDVRVTQRLGDQVQGAMTCQQMNAEYTTAGGGSNSLQLLVADENVIIDHEGERLTGGRAVYTGTNGVLELTNNPTWRAGDRDGSGNVIFIKGQTNEMTVRGNAAMRLPASELSESPGPTNQTAVPLITPARPVELARIFSEGYDMRSEDARFWGGVHVIHPRMDWVCDTATVQLPPAGSTAKGMIAEHGVEFVLRDEKGQEMHGSGDRAVYSFSVPAGVTNETLTLFGGPATLERTNGVFENKTIILDRANNKLTARGSYVIHGLANNSPTNNVLPIKQ